MATLVVLLCLVALAASDVPGEPAWRLRGTTSSGKSGNSRNLLSKSGQCCFNGCDPNSCSDSDWCSTEENCLKPQSQGGCNSSTTGGATPTWCPAQAKLQQASSSSRGSPILPPMPSWKASAQPNPFHYGSETWEPMIREVSMQFDASTSSRWVGYSSAMFDYMGPKYEHLRTLSSCEATSCFQSVKNSSMCVPGFDARFDTWSSLLAQFYKEAQFIEEDVVNGTPCNLFRVNATRGILQQCVDEDGVPHSIAFLAAADAVGISNRPAYSQNLTLYDIVVTTGTSDEAIDPVVCPSLAPRFCEGSGVVATRAYRSTNFNDEGDLKNMDTSAESGIPVTLGPLSSQNFVSRKFYEVYDVAVNTSWGPYRDCNYLDGAHRCTPPSGPQFEKAVGRISAELLEGPNGEIGQCTENLDAGSWFAFPAEGKCTDSQSVGDDGCTWKVTNFKAVETLCMMSFNSTGDGSLTTPPLPLDSPDSGYAKAWAIDYGHPPFPNVHRHVLAALEACPSM